MDVSKAGSELVFDDGHTSILTLDHRTTGSSLELVGPGTARPAVKLNATRYGGSVRVDGVKLRSKR